MKYKNAVTIDYTNWKGVRRLRQVLPMSLQQGSNQYHATKQWFLEALDLEDNAIKSFALKDIHSWIPIPIEE